MNKINLNQIRELLQDTFTNTTIPENILILKMDDFTEWDSLGNFNLLLLAEEKFKIKFSIEEMSHIKSVEQLILVIKKSKN